MRRQFLTIEPMILPGLEPGIKRSDAANYILSKTYARRLGDNLPRRNILLGLAGGLACTAFPFRAAHAVPWAQAVLGGLELVDTVIKVFSPTVGRFFAKNPDDSQLTGRVVYTVWNDNEESEQSVSYKYSFPPNSRIRIKFDKGPAATTPGDKKLQVASSDDQSEGYTVDTDFQAT